MNIRLLTDGDFENLFYTFKMAFTNYEVKLEPTEEEFDYRIHKKLQYKRNISAGCFDGDHMTGFILHASNVYQGIPTAYNGGTGVLPGFRNQKVAEQMYAYLIPKIQSESLVRILLEVIEQNEKAISLYEKIGFTVKRKFKCYKMIQPITSTFDGVVGEGNIRDINFNFNDFEPSFIDSSAQLKLGDERVLVTREGSEVTGYIIFQPHLGRISQMAVDRIHRQSGIGEALLSAAQSESKKPLTIMNIPEDEFGFDAFLIRTGFQNQVNQYEMELII